MVPGNPIEPSRIPKEIREMKQWGIWDRRISRAPLNPAGYHMSSTNPRTWSEWGAVTEKHLTAVCDIGPAFAFAADCTICGIDIDGCRNPKTGEISWWATSILNSFLTYWEVSPSGTGVKLMFFGRLPGDHGIKIKVNADRVSFKEPGIEIYDHARLFSLTGWSPSWPSIEGCQPDLDRLIRDYIPRRRQVQRKEWIHGQSEQKFLTAMEKIKKTPGAVSGAGGHNQTFHMACYLVRGLEMSEAEAMAMMHIYNQKCEPQWSDWELNHKVKSAMKGR